MAVYLIHATHETLPTKHYIGFTNKNPEERLREHCYGGSRHTTWLKNNGYVMELAQVWPEGDRKLETHLKKGPRAKTFCPICTAPDRPTRGGQVEKLGGGDPRVTPTGLTD